jgi:hypothetical protein
LAKKKSHSDITASNAEDVDLLKKVVHIKKEVVDLHDTVGQRRRPVEAALRRYPVYPQCWAAHQNFSLSRIGL